jgi:hypothetical protein
MAVDNPDVVDAIGIERSSGIVSLTISDHLEWDDHNSHLLVLQEKINRYLAFIESGELLESYPKAVGRPVRIDVICKYKPTQTAKEFLDQARQVIEGGGWSFSWRVLETSGSASLGQEVT